MRVILTPDKAAKYIGAVVAEGEYKGRFVRGMLVADQNSGWKVGESWTLLSNGHSSFGSSYNSPSWYKIGEVKDLSAVELTTNRLLYFVGCPLRAKFLKELSL